MSSANPHLHYKLFSELLTKLLSVQNNDELNISAEFLLNLTQLSLLAKTINNDHPVEINNLSELISYL